MTKTVQVIEPRSVLLCGDTHGDVVHIEYLMQTAVRNGAQAIFVLGDFGYWEHMDKGAFLDRCEDLAEQYDLDVYWLDGNHEAHDMLRERYIESALVPRTSNGFVAMRNRLYHAPRAHRWEWWGKRFMALGGAYSIDKAPRLRGEAKARASARAEFAGREQAGKDAVARLSARSVRVLSGKPLLWWPEEEITEEEVAEALDGEPIDVLLCHDKPRRSQPRWNRKDFSECLPNQDRIQRVIEALEPARVFHGHLHYRYEDGMLLPPNGQGDRHAVLVTGLDCNAAAASFGGYRMEDSWFLLTPDNA